MFLFRIPNYYRYLDEPVISFISDLNGLEEDQNYFDIHQSISGQSLREDGAAMKRFSASNRKTSKMVERQESVKLQRENGGDLEENGDYENAEGEDEDEDEEEKEQPFFFFDQQTETSQKSQNLLDQIDTIHLTDTQESSRPASQSLADLTTVGKLDSESLQIEDLFGKIYGIERTLLLKKTDTLKDVIEKITLIPECKLMYCDMISQDTPSGIAQSYPKIKNMLTLSDLFTYIDSSS